MASISSPGTSIDFYLIQRAKLKSQIDSYTKIIGNACRNTFTLEEAKNLVPIAQLVQDNLDVLDGDYQERMLPLIVDWFKKEFFSWFSSPDCEKCKRQLDLSATSTNLEGKQVEHYKCSSVNNCDFNCDFIRHNDPAILLATRKGRCGEWANCFLTLLIALDYEARFVLDTTDHVWNEVWSESQQRWIHVDPCENSIDTPFLYEAGWSKRLEYCIGFGQYEVLDVTPRYTLNFKETLRNKRCSANEVWLENYLDSITMNLLESAPSNVKDIILNHRVKDKLMLKESASKPPDIDKSKYQGRKTGSMAWRIERGEFSPTTKNLYIIKMSKSSNNDDHLFSLQYNSQRNVYESTSRECRVKGWETLTYSSENLDYKYENDWFTSYVSRYESCPSDHLGKVVWKFDLADLAIWNQLEIQVDCCIYPNTDVELQLILFDSTRIEEETGRRQLKINSLNTLTREELGEDVKIFDLIATLMGGDADDEVAWQKPQLFRQTRLKDENQWTFIFKVY